MNREPSKHPTRQWAKLLWEFDFTKRHSELGQFDLITNFEVIEHMSAGDGLRLLRAMKACLRPGGRLLLSTPVFNGKAAKNHINEYTVEALEASIRKAGLRVVQRFGTFASQPDVRKVASAEELDIVERLSAYYSGEVLSCFLAPLYPDASRNNAWLLTHSEGEIKVAKSAQTAAPKGLPDRAEGEGSGAYIRRLLGLGASDDAILERVHAQFPGSKATKSDVSYNKAKLKKEGASVQPAAETKAPKYAAAGRVSDSPPPPWNPAKGVSVTPSAAATALRAAVMTKCKQPALAALLNLSLDLMEKL